MNDLSVPALPALWRRPAGEHGTALIRVTRAVLGQFVAEFGLAELRLWLYILRRSIGFGERSARISLDQFARGACDADGRARDVGTGLSRRAIRTGLRSLEARGLIRR